MVARRRVLPAFPLKLDILAIRRNFSLCGGAGEAPDTRRKLVRTCSVSSSLISLFCGVAKSLLSNSGFWASCFCFRGGASAELSRKPSLWTYAAKPLCARFSKYGSVSSGRLAPVQLLVGERFVRPSFFGAVLDLFIPISPCRVRKFVSHSKSHL